MEEDDDELPEFECGRRLFPVAWAIAANEGLISDEEYVDELIRHTRAENRRTMPNVPWPDDDDSRPAPLSSYVPPPRSAPKKQAGAASRLLGRLRGTMQRRRAVQ